MPQGISEIESLTSFTSDPERFLERLRQRGEPVLLTQQGEAGVVVQDAAAYQKFLERVDRLETIAAVKESLQDVAAGRTRPMREALAELAAKHRLPPVQDE
jgi:PHD/YefM family antitoxin component YafN of YafNO toxin-antitoxin module